MGDKSDNIPGIAGVGEKTALNLIQSYQSLDGVYEHIDEIKGKLKEKLINEKEMAYLSRELATICTDVPVDFVLNGEYAYDFTAEGVVRQLKNLEMNNLLKSLSVTEKPETVSETQFVVSGSEDWAQFKSKTVSVIFLRIQFRIPIMWLFSDGNHTMGMHDNDPEQVKQFSEEETIRKVVHNFKDIYKSMVRNGINPKVLILIRTCRLFFKSFG